MLRLKKPEEKNHFQHKYTFYDQEHMLKFKLLLQLYHKET
jgi:hypothetical protein